MGDYKKVNSEWPKAPLEKGSTQRQLRKARELIAKEAGVQEVNRWLRINWPLEIIFAVGLPIVITVLNWWWTKHVNFYNPLVLFVYTVFRGWSVLNTAATAHEMIHRKPFGEFWTNVWIRFVRSGAGMVDEAWLQRHLLHHQFTFDERDPKLFRAVQFERSKNARWTDLLPWQFKNSFTERSQQFMATEGGNLVKVSDTLMMLDKTSTAIYMLAIFYYVGFVRFVVYAITGLVGGAFFGVGRYIFEHGIQDHDNPLSQGTFYESGILMKIAYYGVPQADGHVVHHIFPTMPQYNILMHATPVINKVLEKHGVKKYTDFWAVIRQWFAGGDYATVW